MMTIDDLKRRIDRWQGATVGDHCSMDLREAADIIERVIKYNERSRDLAVELRESASTHEEVIEADMLDNICDNIDKVLLGD